MLWFFSLALTPPWCLISSPFSIPQFFTFLSPPEGPSPLPCSHQTPLWLLSLLFYLLPICFLRWRKPVFPLLCPPCGQACDKLADDVCYFQGLGCEVISILLVLLGHSFVILHHRLSYNQCRKFKEHFNLIKGTYEAGEPPGPHPEHKWGPWQSTLPHRHEAIVGGGYISLYKEDKFWVLVSAHPGSLKNSCGRICCVYLSLLLFPSRVQFKIFTVKKKNPNTEGKKYFSSPSTVWIQN